MGDDFIEIYFICYYNLYITYYAILAVGSTVYSYAALYNCYYRTYFPPKETEPLLNFWNFCSTGDQIQGLPNSRQVLYQRTVASSNSAPLISHLPISPNSQPHGSTNSLPTWMDLPSLDSYYWWSQRLCGLSCLAPFSVCKVPLWVFMFRRFISLYYWLVFHTILLKY